MTTILPCEEAAMEPDDSAALIRFPRTDGIHSAPIV
jgi:hypothetical protein